MKNIFNILFSNRLFVDKEQTLINGIQLENFIELNKKLMHFPNIDNIINNIEYYTKNILNKKNVFLFLYDKEKNTIWTKKNDYIQINIEKNSILNEALINKEATFSVDLNNDIRYNKKNDNYFNIKTQSMLIFPFINSQNEVIAFLMIYDHKYGGLQNKELDLLYFIHNYASIAIENFNLHQHFKSTEYKIVEKLSSAAELRDEETSNHTKRVAMYSQIMGKEIGLQSQELNILTLVSPMHDIGKIGIPDNILNKPSKLSMNEYEIMKTHAILGHNILKDEKDKILSTGAKIALEHHEKWNGTGYPYQLKEDKISIEGRIVAITDVFDALTSERPYKKAWSIEKTCNLIYEEKGKHFDPQLVDIFLDNFDKIINIKESYYD